jgi:anthraniloyl-CoA monooxygenase
MNQPRLQPFDARKQSFMQDGIACVGGGPASLYFAILMKQAAPERRITVFERQREGAALGWGVTMFLADLDASDPTTAREVRKRAFHWNDMVVHVDGRKPVAITAQSRGHSLGRRALLEILVTRARDLGVELRFEQEVSDVSQLTDYGLVVAADGVNSVLREARRSAFGTSCERGTNKYIWLGTSRVFKSFTFPFVWTPAGWLWAFAYGFDAAMSTFIVETSEHTWSKLGFDQLNPTETMQRLETLFASWLEGDRLQPQIGTRNLTPWLEFQTVTNERWHADNLVLMGDAAHTTHFTIGSGTQLALADAISLATQLQAHARIDAALEAYERERAAAVRTAQASARNSARWFENVTRYMDHDEQRFTRLLLARGSSLLHRVPPQLFLKVSEAADAFPGLARPARRVWQVLHRDR